MVSVVVPAYNEEKALPKCLQALILQDYPKDLYEVIVVDNNSTDKTSYVASKFKNKLNLKIILEKKKGRGHARHTGFKAAKGKYILSTDADTTVPKDWIKKTVALLEREDSIVAVTGPCKINDCPRLTNFVFNVMQPSVMTIYKLAFGHYWLNGFNFGVKREVYRKSGGFDPNLNTMEDVDIAEKIAKHGKIKCSYSLNVVFSGRRFKHGLVQGIKPYIRDYIECFVFKNKNVVMEDVR
ncbi:MAG: glycosyltransferase [Patescibacteria group bacterium]